MDVKDKIYQNILEARNNGKLVCLFWKADIFSSLIWWVCYKHFDWQIPIYFFDTQDYEIDRYYQIAEDQRKHDLKVTTIICKPEEKEEKMREIARKYDVTWAGSEVEGIAETPLPQGQDTWNLARIWSVPFYNEVL